MTRFLPAWIFSVSVLGCGCRAVRHGSRASPSGVQMGILGLGEDRTGCEKTVRGSKWHRGACLGTRAWPSRAMRGGPAWGPSINCAARPFVFHSVLFFPFSLSRPHFALSALLLISCYPGLRLTRRFRLRAPRVSTFPSLPFILVLNGWIDCFLFYVPCFALCTSAFISFVPLYVLWCIT